MRHGEFEGCEAEKDLDQVSDLERLFRLPYEDE